MCSLISNISIGAGFISSNAGRVSGMWGAGRLLSVALVAEAWKRVAYVVVLCGGR